MKILEAEISVNFSNPGLWSDNILGRCSEEEGIVVKEGMLPDTTRSVFVHEVIHIIMKRLGTDKLIKDDSPETLIDNLATGMVSFIKNNPEYIHWIQGGPRP